MKKVLISVDDTKGSKSAVTTFQNLFPCVRPETVILLYVEKLEGRSLMDEVLLSVSEMSTLKEALEGTEYKDALDRKARSILDRYRKELEEGGVTGIKPVVKGGHPAEEILNTAKEEGAELIVIGSRGKRTGHLFMGSVSREVANSADIPVLIAR